MIDNSLFYTCSLIEYIGREKKLRRGDVVEKLGPQAVRRIYDHTDVLHSDPIEHVAEVYSDMAGMTEGDFDNVKACKYTVPTYWDIGKVFTRLIEDVSPDSHIDGVEKVYRSWMTDEISNYNSDLFYQSREYLKECFLAGEILF